LPPFSAARRTISARPNPADVPEPREARHVEVDGSPGLVGMTGFERSPDQGQESRRWPTSPGQSEPAKGSTSPFRVANAPSPPPPGPGSGPELPCFAQNVVVDIGDVAHAPRVCPASRSRAAACRSRGTRGMTEVSGVVGVMPQEIQGVTSGPGSKGTTSRRAVVVQRMLRSPRCAGSSAPVPHIQGGYRQRERLDRPLGSGSRVDRPQPSRLDQGLVAAAARDDPNTTNTSASNPESRFSFPPRADGGTPPPRANRAGWPAPRGHRASGGIRASISRPSLISAFAMEITTFPARAPAKGLKVADRAVPRVASHHDVGLGGWALPAPRISSRRSGQARPRRRPALCTVRVREPG